LTVRSDLDLVFVYEGGTEASSDALRRVRRLVAALSAPTAEGVLYEIDMKLRPSGGQGPAAVSLAAFERYYEEAAQVWELMALTKARMVHADGTIGEGVEAIVRERLIKPRDDVAVREAVRDMRERLQEGHPPRGPFDVKRMAGGLTDIDFVAQGLTLTAGGTERPPRAAPDTLRWHAARGALSENDADVLLRAHRLFEAVMQYGRATFGTEQQQSLREERAARLARLAGGNGGDVAQAVDQVAAEAREVFERLYGSYTD
jgi:glutamate-ammonia-ligase adenylyltransferase